MKEDETSKACSTHAREEDAYKDLVGKPEGKKPLRRPMPRWEYNIRETECKALDWIYFAQDRCQWIALLNTMNILAS
jgi:hypothetical protein